MEKIKIMNSRIEELRRQIEIEESKIRNCKHSFNDPIYDPEIIKEGYGSVQDGSGSDPHWSYEGIEMYKKYVEYVDINNLHINKSQLFQVINQNFNL